MPQSPGPPPARSAARSAASPRRAVRSARLGLPLSAESRLAAAARLDALGVEALGALEAEGVSEAAVALRYTVELEGGGVVVTLDFADANALAAGFAAAHRRRSGTDPAAPPVIARVACTATGWEDD